jgi:hypothetical protein
VDTSRLLEREQAGRFREDLIHAGDEKSQKGEKEQD